MGCCCSHSKNLLDTKKFHTKLIEQPTQSSNFYKLYFAKKRAITKNDPSKMFQLSLVTLNKPTVSQNLSAASTQISVYLQGSEIFSDEISIIIESKAFLNKMNKQSCENLIVLQPSQFDPVSRRTLFICLARAIKNFEAEVDLSKLKIKNIYFCWQKDEAQKFYKTNTSFIEADNSLRIHSL